ncbi:hypothetical protein KUTeg_021085 [Tegillarca granosa]|uniref:Macrophage-expressed gene 1 protein n=1 Tax=Tegillarca granosa TaxID=220873 RepID=A0ABQ9EFQ5_TEGGR|nr:hypothetical protein KUTeg_021085 [Tegillarca granosa]
MARYESQLLVRDFGTHVITSIDAGAAIVQQDQIKSKFTESYSFVKNQILAAASASFFSVASISTEYKHTTTQEMIDQYLQNRTHSHINSYGGPVFKPQNFTLNKWGEQIDNELVAMDRSGDPIYFLITPYSLPELPPSVVYKLIQSVKTAVELYYKFNTYRGCTKRDSPNFSFQANIDDGTCKSKETNFTFGGVYQTCLQSGRLSQNICNGLVQKNPLTGGFSCPKEYEAVLVNSWTSSKSESHHKCHRCWLFAHCCHDSTYYGSAQISSYWCVARDHVDQQHGFLFGGVYTSTVGNLLTQTRSCPLFFYPLKMGRDLYVCVSDDYELGSKYSVPFAGFYSCVSGNPLMLHQQEKLSFKAYGGETVHSLGKYMRNSGPSHWPMGCPPGFSQHLATVENGCQIDFCVKSNAFSDVGLPAIRRPPFMQIPADGFHGFKQL